MINTKVSIFFFATGLYLIANHSTANNNQDCNFLTGLKYDDQTKLHRCWYASGELDHTMLDPDSRSAGWSITDDSDKGWSIAAGWRFFPKWFAELKYSDQGGAAVSNGANRAEIDYTTKSLMLGYDLIHVSDKLHFYLKAGASDIDGNAKGDPSINVKNESLSLSGGGGFEYRWNSPWFARFNADFFSADVQQLGLSINRYIGGSLKHRSAKTYRIKPSLPNQEITVVHIDNTSARTTNQRKKKHSTQAESKTVRTINATENLSKLVIRKSEPIPTPFTTTELKTKSVAQSGLSADCAKLEGVLDDVQFESNSSYLKSSSKSQLIQYANILKRYPNTNIRINAHTDSKGDDHYNQWLSERRARSVATFLSKRGINANQLRSKGVGEKQPIASNDTDEGRKANRRVEFVILKSDSCL